MSTRESHERNHSQGPQSEASRQDSVIPVETRQTEPLADVLSRALYDEPPFHYLMPDERERRPALSWFFSSVIRASQLHGASYMTPAIDGGSLWIGPGRALTFERLVRTELAAGFKLRSGSFKRCVRMGALMEKVHQRLVTLPHWYLVALGAGSAKAENEVREALIEPVLCRADAEGVPCYLEIFHERNLAFYERHGFRIEGGGRIPRCGPNFWSMMRAPRP